MNYIRLCTNKNTHMRTVQTDAYFPTLPHLTGPSHGKLSSQDPVNTDFCSNIPLLRTL